ncbi:MAG: glucose 1-dehydrogenase [Cryomorphaceae bacterium]
MSKEKFFIGKTAIVTGGSKGIGKAVVMAFAERGASVVVSDVAESEGRHVVSEIENQGLRAAFFKCDVSDKEQVQKLIEFTLKKYDRLDFAFNNAGIEGEQAPTGECSFENWQRVMDINLNGVFYCMKYEIGAMMHNSGGVIINCSSTAGKVGFEGIPAYSASKHGVIGLSKTAALDYAKHNIRVNAICPGVVYTSMIDRFSGGSAEGLEAMKEMQPVGRMGHVDEIASGVIWMCTEEAAFMTGQELVMDGGFIAR